MHTSQTNVLEHTYMQICHIFTTKEHCKYQMSQCKYDTII